MTEVSSKLIKITHTDSVVSDEETPLTAIKNSKNTSMWNCIKSQLNGNSNISLSAGNTGVLLVVSRMILKMMDKVSKPALAGFWPNKNGVNVVLDLGANIDCDKFITDNLKSALTSNFLKKITILFSYFALKKFKKKLDPRKYNGAIFLGLNGPVVKSHGGTDGVGFYYSIDLCYKIVKGNLMKQIRNNLSHLSSEKK